MILLYALINKTLLNLSTDLSYLYQPQYVFHSNNPRI